MEGEQQITAGSWNIASFALFRFITGAGIGGEYAAINSTIQELIPARVRGWSDLFINGSFWVGAALGALGSIVLLDPAVIDPEYGWRVAFLIGASLALVIFFMRIWIPESPRWLMTHGRIEEAHRVIAEIESRFDSRRPSSTNCRACGCACAARRRSGGGVDAALPPSYAHDRRADADGGAGVLLQCDLLHLCIDPHRLLRRAVAHVGWYLLPFAAGNFLGPVLIGRLFDTKGRRVMIAFTYIVSGVLLALTGLLFERALIGAEAQTLCWMVIFFFASAAASSAYLTVSETFPSRCARSPSRSSTRSAPGSAASSAPGCSAR